MRNLILTSIFSLLLIVVSGQKTERIYLNPQDSTANYYLAFLPEHAPYKSFMFLIPSFGETPESVSMQTQLPEIAAGKGVLTIIPTFSTGYLSFGIDLATQQSFKEILNNVITRYHLDKSTFFTGGFSIGGSCAIKYAELSVTENYKIKPAAVFAIDPPLDFERFYQSCKRMLRLGIPSQEAVYMTERIREEMGGTPENVLDNYYRMSPYSHSDTTQTAIKSLCNMPIRIYTEPDVEWWIKYRQEDLSGMNALDISAMVNELQVLGNQEAMLITTHAKGYRQPGNRRHPHAWSIADAPELVDWLLKNK